jgi:hypothetical protein
MVRLIWYVDFIEPWGSTLTRDGIPAQRFHLLTEVLFCENTVLCSSKQKLNMIFLDVGGWGHHDLQQ